MRSPSAGGARVSVPDFPSIVRSSLAEPSYGGSLGWSMRDPPYEYVLPLFLLAFNCGALLYWPCHTLHAQACLLNTHHHPAYTEYSQQAVHENLGCKR